MNVFKAARAEKRRCVCLCTLFTFTRLSFLFQNLHLIEVMETVATEYILKQSIAIFLIRNSKRKVVLELNFFRNENNFFSFILHYAIRIFSIFLCQFEELTMHHRTSKSRCFHCTTEKSKIIRPNIGTTE